MVVIELGRLMRYSTTVLIAIIYILVSWIWVAPSQAYPTSNDPVVRREVATISGWVPIDTLQVDIKVGLCPGLPDAAACYIQEYGSIYVRKLYRKVIQTIAHELGHVFDGQILSESDRWRFTAILGLKPQPWSPIGGRDAYDCGKNGVYCPKEWFADDFSGCALDAPTVHLKSGWWPVGVYGAPWTPRIKTSFCESVINIGSEAE
jgi:hypothetical protein